MIVLGSRPRRRERVLAQVAEGSLVLLGLDSGQYFALDEVGARVWDLCDGTRSVTEVVSMISEEYEADPEAIQADILELLIDLDKEQLVAEGS